MMAAIPFIFFTLLTIYWWREHKGLDICTYMSSLFAFTTFLAFAIVLSGDTQGIDGGESGGMLWGGWEPELGVIPTLLFCTTIGLAIMPFSFIHTRNIKNITIGAPYTILAFSAVLILVSLINLYCVADSTLEILSGDLATVRSSSGNGDMTPAEIKAMSLPFPLGHLLYLDFTCTLALPIMFYNICYGKKPWWWNALLFFASTTPILAGIQRADRTEPVYFSLMLLFCIVFFRHAFTRKIKIILGCVIGLVTLLGVVYIGAVSIARFQDRKNGNAVTSIAQYAGQGYLNFCFFWENANTNEIATEREFPLMNHFFAKIDSNPERRGERSAKHGFFISVFATFAGDILLDIGAVGLIIWIFVYSLFTTLVIKYRNRKQYDISEVLAIFFLASIPLFGVFYYRYFSWHIAFNYVIIGLLWIASKYRIVYK